jgi:hypothetical protein
VDARAPPISPPQFVAVSGRPDAAEPPPVSLRRPAAHSAAAPASIVAHYGEDDSIFIDEAYLIKGIAGRIFWKLLQQQANTGRVDFTNKELRLDASLQLPDFKDNLEARLILLRHRLEDHCDFVRLTKAGRGHFHLDIRRQLTLDEHS